MKCSWQRLWLRIERERGRCSTKSELSRQHDQLSLSCKRDLNKNYIFQTKNKLTFDSIRPFCAKNRRLRIASSYKLAIYSPQTELRVTLMIFRANCHDFPSLACCCNTVDARRVTLKRSNVCPRIQIPNYCRAIFRR